jgi:hypothetical protein
MLFGKTPSKSPLNITQNFLRKSWRCLDYFKKHFLDKTTFLRNHNIENPVSHHISCFGNILFLGCGQSDQIL